jgi:hypothetical protein
MAWLELLEEGFMKHPLYSVAEAAHLLNRPYQPVWYAVTTRRTKARKVGRSWILNQRNLEELARYFQQVEAAGESEVVKGV